MMKIFGWATTTLVAVIAFAALLFFMLKSEKADAGVYLGLGHTFGHSNVTAPEVGYRFLSYGVALEGTGEGDNGVAKPIVSVYRFVDPGWCYDGICLASAIGFGYTPSQSLIGPLNYRLEIVVSYNSFFEIYAKHYSSAGFFENNTGLDSAGIRYKF